MDKYKAGDASISAQDFNRALEAADAYFRSQHLGQTSGSSSGPGQAGGLLVKALNDTGAAIRHGEVVELTDWAVDEASQKAGYLWFKAKNPGNYCAYGPPWHIEYGSRTIAFAKEPVPANTIGLFQIGGVAHVLIDVQETTDTHGKLRHSQRTLKGCTWGHASIHRFRTTTINKGEQLLLCAISPHGGFWADLPDVAVTIPPTD